MSATIVLEQSSGTPYGVVQVAKTEFYFLSVDNCLADFDDSPVPILDSGLNYSYEVWLAFRCDAAPVTNCTNFKIWTSGSLSTGLDITVNTDDVTVYETPTDSQSVRGTRDSILNYTSGNKLDIGGTLVDIGDKSNFIVFQQEVDDTADINPAGFEVLTIMYQYDES